MVDDRNAVLAGQPATTSPSPQQSPSHSSQPGEAIDIWCITDMAQCNFECPYCCAYEVVTKDKAWRDEGSYNQFLEITERIAKLPYRIRMRLQTMGEPFVSKEFLARVGWLTKHDNVEFVEMVTNGSLLKARLKLITEADGDLSKVSLWTTFHHTEIKMDKFLTQVEFAQEAGCFVVVNSLAFPDSIDMVEELHAECVKRGIRINVDPGYRDGDSSYAEGPLIAMEAMPGGMERLRKLTANETVLEANLLAAKSADGYQCSAGQDYFIVSPDGRVGPCCPLLNKGIILGNLLDPNYTLTTGKKEYIKCNVDKRVPVLSRVPVIGSAFRQQVPCKNKEDFGHLRSVRDTQPRTPSLGWFGD